jgi:hypothetical protein
MTTPPWPRRGEGFSAPRTPDPARTLGGAFADAGPRPSLASAVQMQRTPDSARLVGGPGFARAPPSRLGYPAPVQGGAPANRGPRNPGPDTPSQADRGSTPLVGMEEATPTYKFETAIQNLFSMAERFCFSHMNIPSSAKDGLLHETIKDRLMKAASRETAHQIAATGATRYFLMAKVVIQWIIKHVCKTSLFAGFDPDADVRIARLKDSIFQGMLKL